MKARIQREGEVIIVHLAGHVDVETAAPFRDVCLSRLKWDKVVFDFRELNFVGSSGLLPFLETMQDFSQTNPNSFKLCGVSSEFQRLFASTSLANIEIYETGEEAASAYLNPREEGPPSVGPSSESEIA